MVIGLSLIPILVAYYFGQLVESNFDLFLRDYKKVKYPYDIAFIIIMSAVLILAYNFMNYVTMEVIVCGLTIAAYSLGKSLISLFQNKAFH